MSKAELRDDFPDLKNPGTAASRDGLTPPAPPFPSPQLPPRYSGASDAAISRTIDNALGLPRGTPAVVRDPEDGSALAISDSIPSGVTLDAKPAAAVAIPGAAAAAAAARGGNGVMGDPPAFIDGKKSKWHDGGGSGKGSDEGGGGSRGTSRSQSPPMNRSDDGFHGGGSDSGKGRGVEGGSTA